jgi:hypothetical protein
MKLSERFLWWIAWHLPKPIVYLATVRLAAHATSGKYGDTEVPALKVMDALDRWEGKP